MIYSMTGYGRAVGTSNGKELVVELKSLNGKQFEITNKLTPLIKAYEMDVRKEISQQLKRGSLDVSIQIRQDGSAKPMHINTTLAKSYYNAIHQLSVELGLGEENVLSTLMKMPEVVAADTDSISDEDWALLQELITTAVQHLKDHRALEGTLIEKDLLNRIQNIETYLIQAETFEPLRIEKIKERIGNSLEEWVANEKIDMNRFEQELIYYIEKIDISEEKQRLRSHIQYFRNLITNGTDEGVGKKLGFVLQEVGREINTLGSKANHADMQQIVVNMKDELEKAKEQVLNVL